VEKGSWRPRELSRRDFLKAGGAGLKAGGAGLAGAAFLGAAGCTGDEQSGGTTKLYFTSPADATQFNASLKAQTTPKDAARTLKRELESIIQQSQES
jgi:hypothetical protein